jgi:hypothetical protein
VRKTLLWIHLASVAVFAGATALMLVQMASFTPMSPESFAAVRETVSTGARDVVLPALLVTVASGMLLVVARPMLIEARWVWAKAAVGLALAAFVLLHAYPTTRLASAMVGGVAASSVLQQGAPRDASQPPLEVVLVREERGQWIVLALAALATALAVWRPRLGRRSDAEHG